MDRASYDWIMKHIGEHYRRYAELRQYRYVGIQEYNGVLKSSFEGSIDVVVFKEEGYKRKALRIDVAFFDETWEDALRCYRNMEEVEILVRIRLKGMMMPNRTVEEHILNNLLPMEYELEIGV